MDKTLREFSKAGAKGIDAAAADQPLSIVAHRTPDAIAAPDVRAKVLHRAVRAAGKSTAFARSKEAPTHHPSLRIDCPCTALIATKRTQIE